MNTPMVPVCPYHDCTATDLVEVAGTHYLLCQGCRRTSLACPKTGCSGANRPFMRFCRACGRPLEYRHDYSLRARRATADHGGDQNVFSLSSYDSVSEAAKCRLLQVQGILILQFDDGNIFGLFPFRSGADAVIFHAQLDARDAPLFAPVVAGDHTLIFSSQQQIWRLPLIRLWSREQSWSDSAETLRIHRVQQGWNLASAPVVLSCGERGAALFALLQGSGDQARWVWMRDAADQPDPLVHTGRLGDIRGNRYCCLPISERMVAIATPKGHWILRNDSPDANGVWDNQHCDCVQTLDKAISWGLDFERPSAFLSGSFQNGPTRTDYLRWYFVGEDPDRPMKERRLWHYQDSKFNDPSPATPDLAPRGKGVRPVGQVVTRVSENGPLHELLAVNEKQLFLCDRVGSVRTCGPNLGEIAFRDVQSCANRVFLMWDTETTSTFGIVEFDQGRADLSLTKTLGYLQCMPVVVGPHVFAVHGEGRDTKIVCHSNLLVYRQPSR